MLDLDLKSDITVTTPEKMREAERELMSSGTSEAELIERASEKITGVIMTVAPDFHRLAVVIGGGNNGSDGISTAIRLTKAGKRCVIYDYSAKKNAENARLTDIARSFSIPIITNGLPGEDHDAVLDCLFGIGLDRDIEGAYKSLIEHINAMNATVISADIPSGLCAKSGRVLGACIRADFTVALGAIKTGHLLGSAADYVGKLCYADIGISAKAIAVITDQSVAVIKKRLSGSHKGSYGRISIIGGSDCMPGAPLMSYESAVAASRCGAGLVRLCVGEDEKCAYKSRVTEQTLFYLPEQNGYICFDQSKFRQIAEWSDVIAIGMGMGANPHLPEILEFLSHNFDGTLVIDADGLNALSADISVIEGHSCRIVLTPHIGEFARLFPSIMPYEVEKIAETARKLGVTVAVKSSVTVITDGESTYINLTGTPAMAKGGSGDVLAGMIAAFCAVQSPTLATVKACYHFGKCGEKAAARLKSEVSVLASDIIIEQNGLL